MKIDKEKLKNLPKAYYVVAVMAVIVFGLLIFGKGADALNAPGELFEITTKCKTFEELIDEDGTNESVLITTTSTKAKFEVSAYDISDYQLFITTLSDGNPELQITFQKEDSKLLNKDETIEVEKILVSGIDFKYQ